MNTTTRQPLGGRFTRLWSAATVSFLGDGVMLAAFPLAAAQLTDNAMLIAGTQIARGLPWLFFGLFGGALVDRIDRRVAMVTVDLIRAVAVAALFFAVWNGSATIALIWIIAFVLGTGEVVFDPASQALVPNVVSTDALQRASGRLIASESVAKELAGPAVGGLLFALAAWTPFLINAVSFAVAAAILAGMRGRYRPARTDTTTTVRADLAEGWQFLRSNRLLLSFAIFGAVSNFAAAAVEATLVLFAIQALHLGDAGFGLLLAAASIGGVAASLTADRTLNRFGPGTVYIVGSAAAGAAMLVAAATSNGAVCAALFAIVFAAIAYGDVLAYSLRAELVPDHLRGRVNSIYRTMLWVAWPLGALVGGLLVTTVGVRVPIALFGIASFAIAGAASAFANNRTIAHARQLAPVEVDLTQPDDDHLSSAQGAAAEAIAERPTQIF